MKKSVNSEILSKEREEYWNGDYIRYWKARVEEANKNQPGSSVIVIGDSKTSADNLYLQAIGLLKIGKRDKVLELGCGFGRSLPMLCKAALHVTAVDISKEMIRVAKESCHEANIEFHVSPSEDLPFGDETFAAVPKIWTVG